MWEAAPASDWVKAFEFVDPSGGSLMKTLGMAATEGREKHCLRQPAQSPFCDYTL